MCGTLRYTSSVALRSNETPLSKCTFKTERFCVRSLTSSLSVTTDRDKLAKKRAIVVTFPVRRGPDAGRERGQVSSRSSDHPSTGLVQSLETVLNLRFS